jgi:DNA-3-methyladenine glycosylase
VVAVELLGSQIIAGGVVVQLTEVEAYAGEADPASHAARGPTPRNRVMYGPAGRVYVYFSYGMHHCVNLVCGEPGTASAVLLRAGRVVSGLPEARLRRRREPSPGPGDQPLAGPRHEPPPGGSHEPRVGHRAEVADVALARGPGNLARALGLTLEATGTTIWDGPLRWTPATAVSVHRSGPRVGVSRAADVAWRFWLPDEPSVSSYRRHPQAPPPSAPTG